MSDSGWPVMSPEQWRRLVEATTLLMDSMRVHLGAESDQYQLLNLAARLAFEELERRIDARQPAL